MLHTQVQLTNVYFAWLDFYSTTAGGGIETLASKHNDRNKNKKIQNEAKQVDRVQKRKMGEAIRSFQIYTLHDK